MSRIEEWIKNNLVCVLLVILFIPLFVVTTMNQEIFNALAGTDFKYLEGQYYRWFTAIFIHHSFGHIFFNSIALISIGSLISPFIGKWKTLLIFTSGGVLAEAAYSIVVNFPVPIYDGGSSGGIFALMGCFMVCYLRFPQKFHLKWFRPDVIVSLLYFILVNNNVSSFLTHTFGFVFGTVITFIMVIGGFITDTVNNTGLSADINNNL